MRRQRSLFGPDSALEGEDIHYKHLHLVSTPAMQNELNDVECMPQKHFRCHFADIK